MKEKGAERRRGRGRDRGKPRGRGMKRGSGGLFEFFPFFCQELGKERKREKEKKGSDWGKVRK